RISVFDFYDRPIAALAKGYTIIYLRAEQSLADWRNPADCILYKIHLIHTDDPVSLKLIIISAHCYHRAEDDAFRPYFRKPDNCRRGQSLLQFRDLCGVSTGALELFELFPKPA